MTEMPSWIQIAEHVKKYTQDTADGFLTYGVK